MQIALRAHRDREKVSGRMPEMRERQLDDSVLDIRRAHRQRRNIFTRFFRKRVVLDLFRLRLHAPFLRLPLTRALILNALACSADPC